MTDDHDDEPRSFDCLDCGLQLEMSSRAFVRADSAKRHLIACPRCRLGWLLTFDDMGKCIRIQRQTPNPNRY